ncbi:MAG TPA: acyl-CoA dehydrogenase family protein, partial [Candidatus Kryptonia bacterium]|nr:acyl-CoA dehydrogenase family protein [Candidatus Kryptonia bacterium]
MRLAPTPEQAELKAAVRRFCEEQINPDRLGAWSRFARGIDGGTWRSIAELGWFGLGLPTEVGGSGQGLVEVGCLLEECSRGLVPLAVINAIRGARALATIDARAPELHALARGDRAVTLALDERTDRDPARFAARLEPRGGTLVVSGEKWFVADAADADFQIVAARDGDDVALVLVARDDAVAMPLRSFDSQP